MIARTLPSHLACVLLAVLLLASCGKTPVEVREIEEGQAEWAAWQAMSYTVEAAERAEIGDPPRIDIEVDARGVVRISGEYFHESICWNVLPQVRHLEATWEVLLMPSSVQCAAMGGYAMRYTVQIHDLPPGTWCIRVQHVPGTHSREVWVTVPEPAA